MNISKKIVLITMISIFSIGLVACSKKEQPSSQKYISTQQIKQSIIEDELLTVQPITEIAATKYEILDPVKDKIKDGVVMKSSDESKLQDIIIVEAKTTKDAEIIEGELITYQAYLKDESPYQAGDYGVQNEEVAATTLVGRKGKYVYLVSAPTLFDIEDKILSYIE